MEIAWYIPVLIFSARIVDVSIGTIRMIFVINGARYVAAALGFFEVLVWVLAVGGVVKYLDNPWALVAFAGGFSAGTLLGMRIEQFLAIGYRVVRVINADRAINVSGQLRDAGYHVTSLDGHGRTGPVEIAFLALRRRALPELLAQVERIAPEAFLSIGRADRAKGNCFINGDPELRSHWSRFGMVRK